MTLWIQDMKTKAFYLYLLLIIGFIPAISQAGVITQTINFAYNPWSPTNYQKYLFRSFDHSLGSLTSVAIDSSLSGSKLSTERLSGGISFYAENYPFSTAYYYYLFESPIGQSDFMFKDTRFLGGDDPYISDFFSDLKQYPYGKFFEFTSQSPSMNYFITGTTKLTYYYKEPVSVPESASMYLMILGLLGFGAFRKFNKNAKRAE